MVSSSRIARVANKASRFTHRNWIFLFGVTMLCCGCSKETTVGQAEGPGTNNAPYMASGGGIAQEGIDVDNPALQRFAQTNATAGNNASAMDLPAPIGVPVTGEVGLAGEISADGSIPNPVGTTESANPATPSNRKPTDKIVGRTQLRPDLSPSQLIQFLAVADRDMQDIWSRLTQIQGGREELIRVARMKLEASRRLKQHAEADEPSKSIGARGELQALSHLASFSDLKSAEELEGLARENLASNDPALVSDSRLVLIGFGLESLQNGKPGAADQVLEYIEQLATPENSKDVPTLMVMGQARDALAGYGHEEQANRVRDLIVDVFANSPNQDLARAAAEVAGTAVYDKVEQLFTEVLRGESVTVAQWRTAVDQLIAEAPNLRTVAFLSGAALQLEAVEQESLVQTTFDAMITRFDDPNSDPGREARIAMEASDARRQILGVRFNPRLPSIDGSEISMETYRGRVVMVPFWAAAFPESLQLIPMLKDLQAAHPDELAIVGINLDGNDKLLEEFASQNDLGFPNFRSKSSLQAEVANPIATQFGIASMPFLAILDQQGQVAEINFTGKGIEKTLNRLMEQ